MMQTIRTLLATSLLFAAIGSADALPIAPQAPQIVSPMPQPAADLLCGRGWHYSWFTLHCERNPHICPAGQFWVSMLRLCL